MEVGGGVGVGGGGNWLLTSAVYIESSRIVQCGQAEILVGALNPVNHRGLHQG